MTALTLKLCVCAMTFARLRDDARGARGTPFCVSFSVFAGLLLGFSTAFSPSLPSAPVADAAPSGTPSSCCSWGESGRAAGGCSPPSGIAGLPAPLGQL
eukprot:6186585-Pleurochrysis_carterae.AAC.2